MHLHIIRVLSYDERTVTIATSFIEFNLFVAVYQAFARR